jgi:AcrR family transcriptional regulator
VATRADPAARRAPLSRDRVISAAIDLADREGIEALTMRRLAQELGVEAMTLYYHVASKEEILNGIVDMVLNEFELPVPGSAWKPALRRTAISAHDVLVRHKWAASLMLTPGTVSEARMRYMDAILGTLREGGFSAHMTDQGYHALESHISGFTLWQVGMALDPETLPDLATGFLASLPDGAFPYLVEHIHQHLAERDPEDEGAFVFGLDLILDGLERILHRSATRQP